MFLIFDFDGVWCKASWKGLFEAYKEIIAKEGKDYKEYFANFREFKEWWNPNWKENNRKIGIKEESLDKSHKIFYEIYNSYVYIFSWTGEILQDLAKKHQLALFTNRHRENAGKIIGSNAKYFSIIIGGEDVCRLKPHPEGIIKILEKKCCLGNDAVMIGDMPEDIIAGKSAGIKTGAVRWGLGKWEKLLAQKPDHKFEKPRDLLKI